MCTIVILGILYANCVAPKFAGRHEIGSSGAVLPNGEGARPRADIQLAECSHTTGKLRSVLVILRHRIAYQQPLAAAKQSSKAD